jgi:hypothetical protein
MSVPTRPTVAQLVERVEALGQIVDAQQDWIETLGRGLDSMTTTLQGVGKLLETHSKLILKAKTSGAKIAKLEKHHAQLVAAWNAVMPKIWKDVDSLKDAKPAWQAANRISEN